MIKSLSGGLGLESILRLRAASDGHKNASKSFQNLYKHDLGSNPKILKTNPKCQEQYKSLHKTVIEDGIPLLMRLRCSSGDAENAFKVGVEPQKAFDEPENSRDIIM